MFDASKVLVGAPKAVLEELCITVQGVSVNPLIADFYIGKTSDLKEAMAKHNCSSIKPVYRSINHSDVDTVESNLRDLFIDYEKCCNKRYSPDEFYFEGKEYYVYVALWV